MPNVDLCLILIVHLIQNQLVFIKKAKNAGIGKTWDYSGMSSWILQDCTSVWLCIEKTQNSFKEVWVDGMFPMKSSANESYGKIPMVYNPESNNQDRKKS